MIARTHNRWMSPLLVITSVAVLGASPAVADDVTIYVGQDAYVSEMNPTNNFNGSGELWVGYYPSTKRNRTYLYFDLSTIPAGSTISSAKLYVYCYGTLPGTLAQTKAYRVYSSSWSESSINWNNQPYFYSTGYGSANINAVGWYSFTVTSIVRSWWDTTSPNYGFCLHMDDTGTTIYKLREKPDANRAYLKVAYTPPSPDLVVSSITGVSSSYNVGDRINATATIQNVGAAGCCQLGVPDGAGSAVLFCVASGHTTHVMTESCSHSIRDLPQRRYTGCLSSGQFGTGQRDPTTEDDEEHEQ